MPNNYGLSISKKAISGDLAQVVNNIFELILNNNLYLS